MTPLIDVIFLLLIFFMISTTFIETDEIKIVLPEVSTRTAQKVKAPLEIVVDAKNRVFINKKQIQLKSLKRKILGLKHSYSQQTAIIRADGEVKHKLIVHIMDTLQQVGIKKISVATRIQTS